MQRIFITLFILSLTTVVFTQQTVGAFQNDSAAYNGYTLIAPEYTSTYLIDNCGRVVNQWESDHRPGSSAYLLDNGDLLRTAAISGVFNAGGQGGRIERYDWEGNMIWQYDYATFDYHQHHDIELLPNGNVLLLVWDLRTTMEAINNGRDPDLTSPLGVWSERIVEIEPQGANGGEVVWVWDLWDHLIQDYDSTKANYGIVANHPELVDINFEANAGGGASSGPDWIHFNAIDYNAELDQIVVSSRHLHEFWIIDHSATSVEAAGSTGGNAGRGGDLLYRWGNPQAYQRGTESDQQLFGPHDVHWIPQGLTDAGKIMIFNNGWQRPGEDYSTIDILNPPKSGTYSYSINEELSFGPEAPDWQYIASPPESFSSLNVSGAQRLPNGNTLICSGRSGYIFEITPEEEIVWTYQNPVRSGTGPLEQEANIFNNPLVLFRAYRYDPDDPAFEGRVLDPGDPIELNPIDYGCTTFDISTDIENLLGINKVRLVQNPVSTELQIVNETGAILLYEVYNSSGQLQARFNSSDVSFRQDIFNWPLGFYVLRISEINGAGVHSIPFIKL
jgi:hypothetical protein